MSELYEKLNDIKEEKNNEMRMKRLRDVCSERDILNDAFEIAKHESTIALPSAILITALTGMLVTVVIAFFINLVSDPRLKAVALFSPLILYFILAKVIYKIGINNWTNLCYDLIELRRERREEFNVSKLDTIISKVEETNQKIDNFRKIVSAKSEAIEKEIITLKRK